MDRAELEKEYGNVYNTEEVQEKYKITSFLAPFCFCIERKTGIKGCLQFQDMPRYYFHFTTTEWGKKMQYKIFKPREQLYNFLNSQVKVVSITLFEDNLYFLTYRIKG